nr:unnamed protein product [Callosobruchus analis]
MSKLKTGVGEKEVQFKADIPSFPEFQCHDDITFILFDFHSFFDGILGLKQLLKLGLNIDLQNKFLISKCLKIPIHFCEPDIEPYQITVHAHEVAALSIPVSLDNGDVIIPESEINGLYLPETLTTARDGFATTEVYNYSDSTVTVEFRQPLNLFSALFKSTKLNKITKKSKRTIVLHNKMNQKENYIASISTSSSCSHNGSSLLRDLKECSRTSVECLLKISKSCWNLWNDI